MATDGTDRVFKALADRTRRAVLDRLREAPRTTGDLCACFPALSRFGVMKHLEVLVDAGLVLARREGRSRVNALNVVPLQRLYERWMRPYEAAWASGLLTVQRLAERAAGGTPPAPDRAAARPSPLPEPSRSRARSPGTRVRPARPTKEDRP
jgi:DNA-binding transcriptional ArsR family regulator